MKPFNRAEVYGTLKDYKEEKIESDKGEFVKGTAIIERTYSYKRETKTQLIAVTFMNNEYNDYSWLKGVQPGSEVFVIGGVVSREYKEKYYTDFRGREIKVIPSKKQETKEEEVNVDDIPF